MAEVSSASDDNEELYKKYRPRRLQDVVGQKDAVAALTAMGASRTMPHTLLFTGPSGCGKTTLARIVRKMLGCADCDFVEQNSAQFRGIDSVRDIQANVGLAAMGGKGSCRVWLIDEVHQITGAAQEAFLKLLEDTPKHVYFFLATTDPGKLKKAVLTRCTEVKVKAVSEADLIDLVNRVLAQEKREVAAAVAKKLATVADGSPRKALVLLHQIIRMTDQSAQMHVLEMADSEAAAFSICQLLGRKAAWGAVGTVVGDVLEQEGQDVEGLRYMVLGYFKKVLLSGGQNADRASKIISLFEHAFYDGKAASFVRACYEASKL